MLEKPFLAFERKNMEIIEALGYFYETLEKLQQNLHIDLVGIKEELKHNNKELTLISEGIKKQVEYEEDFVQVVEEKEEDKKIINHIIQSIKDLNEASIMLRKDIEILKMKIGSEE